MTTLAQCPNMSPRSENIFGVFFVVGVFLFAGVTSSGVGVTLAPVLHATQHLLISSFTHVRQDGHFHRRMGGIVHFGSSSTIFDFRISSSIPQNVGASDQNRTDVSVLMRDVPRQLGYAGIGADGRNRTCVCLLRRQEPHPLDHISVVPMERIELSVSCLGGRCVIHNASSALVLARGIEPRTFCVSSRCSAN